MPASEPYLEVTVGATPDAVWRALRDPDEIARWFGWDYDGLEGEIALIFHGEVPDEAALPEGLDSAVAVDEAARSLTTGAHRIDVAEGPQGAVVRVTRVIDVGDDGWEVFHSEVDAIEEGWRTFFQQLAFVMAHHPGEARATVFAMGQLTAPLGDAAVDAEPGQPYTATVAGLELAGSVWFRSELQLGLTVDAWGDGLLVAAHMPDGGPSMVIGSTYGLAPDALTPLQAALTTWFASNGEPLDPTAPPTEDEAQ